MQLNFFESNHLLSAVNYSNKFDFRTNNYPNMSLNKNFIELLKNYIAVRTKPSCDKINYSNWSTKLTPWDIRYSLRITVHASSSEPIYSVQCGSELFNLKPVNDSLDKTYAVELLDILRKHEEGKLRQPEMEIWKNILSKNYNLTYCDYNKQVLHIYLDKKPEHTPINHNGEFIEVKMLCMEIASKDSLEDITSEKVEINVDEIHYHCDGCMNLPLFIGSFWFYNNGVPIYIKDAETWKIYRDLGACYTYKNRYVKHCDEGLDIDHNQCIQDYFNPDNKVTGYYYELINRQLYISKVPNSDWHFIPETALHLLKLADKVVFTPLSIEDIKSDLSIIKLIVGQDIAIEISFAIHI
jgi:hypothetical protein